MPQIANQDYNFFQQTYRGFAALAKAVKMGTIFDCCAIDLIVDGGKFTFRTLSVYEKIDGTVDFYYVSAVGDLRKGEILHTSEQYTVMADIEDGGGDPLYLMKDDSGYLNDDEFYICVDGKYIAVTLDDNDKIASYEITNVEAVGVDIINIPIEDAPGLIGLFAGN